MMKEKSLLQRIFPKFKWRRRHEGGSEQDAPAGTTDPDTETTRPLNTPNSTIPNIEVAYADPGPVATSSHSISIQKGPNLGLRVLYNPPEDLPVAVDIIFVHGLTGNAYNTWCSDGRVTIHWPRDLLKTDIPDARIMSFGYDADVVGWFSPVSNNRVGNHAENLLGAVTRLKERTESENRSIIFVMHSLGGLVVQNALDLSRSSPESHLRKLESNTLGLLFMGTPSFGSDKARWGSFAAAMVGIVRKTNKPIVHVLTPDSEMLASIQKRFHEVLRLRERQSLAIRITCFYEELDMIAVGTIVEKKSAIITGYSSYGIHADHRGMTKFEDNKNKGYEDVLGELLRWTKEAREVQAQTMDHQV
ncbi:P-loop containing nucleoside triphosphate hydrolase [Diaporthe sp. PMI_573]|nr:P-loop containing nucleoside triphosphate hydrolase [Diaporthaceae sp. PMI_573]